VQAVAIRQSEAQVRRRQENETSRMIAPAC